MKTTAKTKDFFNVLGGWGFSATYVTRDQLKKLDVLYYFTDYNDDDSTGWDIFRDGNYDEFHYTENH